MIWGFVDYENIGSLKDVDFTRYQRLFIFCGPKNSNIKLGNAVISEFIRIELIKLKTSGFNNLDFHIAYYLGQFSNTAEKDIQFHIITGDNGFNEKATYEDIQSAITLRHCHMRHDDIIFACRGLNIKGFPV